MRYHRQDPYCFPSLAPSRKVAVLTRTMGKGQGESSIVWDCLFLRFCRDDRRGEIDGPILYSAVLVCLGTSLSKIRDTMLHEIGSAMGYVKKWTRSTMRAGSSLRSQMDGKLGEWQRDSVRWKDLTTTNFTPLSSTNNSSSPCHCQPSQP